MNSNNICHTSPAKKWNAHFWIMFYFWWLAWLVDGFKPHLPPLYNQKNEMLIFGLCSTSVDQLGWSMERTTCATTSLQPRIMKCSFLDYDSTSDDQLGWLMDSNPKKSHFWTTLTSDDWMGWLIDSNCSHPCPANKMKCSFLDYVQHLMMGRADRWTQTPSTTSLQPKNEMLTFGLCLSSDD